MDSFVVTISPSLTNMTFDFSDVSMSADQQAALRFYGFEAGDNAGTFRLDNVLIDGAVIPAPVPETSTAATIIFSACFVVWRVARCGYARRKERLASSTANSSNSSQGPCR
jgi:hypothetical protein